MPGPFPPLSPSAAAPTNKLLCSSPCSHSPCSDSALLHTSKPTTTTASQQRRPVSVPPTFQSDYTVPKTDEEPTEDNTSDTTPATTMSALFSRQHTINEDEEEDELAMLGNTTTGDRRHREDEEANAMPDFGTALMSDFALNGEQNGGMKNGLQHGQPAQTTAEEIIMLEEDGPHGPAFPSIGLATTTMASDSANFTHLPPQHDEAVQQTQQQNRKHEGETGTEQNQRRQEEGEQGDTAEARRAARQRRREPIVVDCRTLEMAMGTSDDDGPSPLEHYLLGTTLLGRLCPLFELAAAEAQRTQLGKFKMPIREYNVNSDGVLSIALQSYPMPLVSVPTTIGSPAGDQQHFHQQQVSHCMVRLQLMVCPQEFRLVAKLNYSGQHCPAEADVLVFERFFAREVVRLTNELAVFTFVTLCRLCYPPIFHAFAQLMQAQMDNKWPWRADLELVHTDEVPQQSTGGQANAQQQQKTKFSDSIVVTDMCKRFIFFIQLKPREKTPLYAQQQQRKTQQQQQHTNDKRRLTMLYDVDGDELTLFKPSDRQPQTSEEIQAIESVLKTQTELVRQQKQQTSASSDSPHPAAQRTCCIWPCIRALLGGQHQQQKQQPQQMMPLTSTVAPHQQQQLYGRG